jgi:ArsR family transcriptional regulator
MTPRPQAIDFERTARVFHALADPIRLRIVDLLRSGERCVCELTDAMSMAQSKLSFHLKGLKDAGVVQDRKEGRWVYYRLNPDRVQEVAGILGDCCAPGREWMSSGCCQ